MRIVFKTSYDADINMFKHNAQRFWYILLLALAIALPWLVGEFWVGEFTTMLIWSISGMGLMLLVGHTGQASLGHAAFMAVGAYCSILAQNNWGMPFWLSVPFGAAMAGLAGYLVALPTTKLHGIYLAIATLAIGILAEDLIVVFEHWTGGVSGVFPPFETKIGPITLAQYSNVAERYWLVLAITIAILWAYRNILRSPLGRSFAAVRDSEVSARAMGVNLARTRAISFAISCAITGVAGALLGQFAGFINNETFNIILSITLFLMIVIGGLGFIQGAFFGAAVITFLPSIISFVRDWMSVNLGTSSVAIPGLETGIFAAILISFILFEPMGIMGRWLKIRTYFELFPFYRRDMFRRQKSYLKTERMR